MKKVFLPALAVCLMLAVGPCRSQTSEFRSMEATAWGSGFESPTATTTMVNYMRSCNLNCVIPEIRLRSDAYYNSTIEPRGTGVAPSPGYDSLADLVTKAHAVGMEVHPWVVTFRIWTTDSGPAHMTPEHIWYTHGPGNTDPSQDWCMRSDTGAWSYGGTSNLDPGHPDVESYLISVFMEIVNNYDVDGLNLDYIRYPSTNWGYNAVSVARFNAEYGRTGNPSASDSTWQNWRRDQITNLVKRLYLEIKAVKPWVKLSPDGWNSSSTGNASYFQDWDKWTTNHWVDFVHPMSYTSNNTTFHGWLDTYLTNQHGRHVYPLVDVSNDINGNVLPQIDLIRQHGFQGLGLYSYQSIPDRTALQSALVSGSFPTFVSPAGMSWLDSPTKGYIKGFVKNSGGVGIYPATVTIVSTGASTKDTGTGFYGFVDITPGTYSVTAAAAGYNSQTKSVTVTAGQVANLNFTLSSESSPPVISNVRASSIQATNAQILWGTDEASTSQVDYGLTAAYGTTTVEDTLAVTYHTVQLVGLNPSTTYHYRVRSWDAARNMSVSGDYTFTTAAGDQPDDIIIDNTDVKCVTSGSWFTSTSAATKYGTNYFYCSNAGGTKTATWTPSILTAGNYDVYGWWPAGTNRSAISPFTIQWNGGSQTIAVNQQDTANDNTWRLLRANTPFAVGTAGYVRLSNTGIEDSRNVIADAIKFVYAPGADTTPPSAPTNLAATASALGQISLTWTASTDNIGVTGYRVYRNGSLIGSPTGTSYISTGLAANTQYSYYVTARDAADNVSAPSATVARYSLSVAPGASSITCDKAINTWQSSPTFTFTATGGFGAGTLQYYRYAWTQNSTYTFTGLEGQWTAGNITPQASATGSWYLHVKGYNGDGVANGTYSYGPYKYDGTPPTAPTGLTASATATDQVSLSWTASTDDVGVTGYRVYRDGSLVGSPTATSYASTGLAANTQYSYHVTALDALDNESEASIATAKYTLSAAPGSGSVTCDKAVNTWQSTSAFTFTAVGGFGAGKVQYYRYAWTQSSSYSWTGGEDQWASGTLVRQASANGLWYLHVQGNNGDGVPNGTFTYGPYRYDATAPTVSGLSDGKYAAVGGSLQASWSGSDAESGIAEYQYAIGTSADNIGSVAAWTSTGTSTSITRSGLNLVANQKYYFGVKARNGAGAWSTPVVSDGVTAAAVLSSIRAAKGRADGDAIMLSDKIVSANYATFFYICEDRTSKRVSGIRVAGNSPTQGYFADVAGILATVNGERVITAPDTMTETGPGAPDPLFMNNRSVGGEALNVYTPGVTGGLGTHNIGMLVTIAGRVVESATGCFDLTDGARAVRVSTARLTSVPGIGSLVKVTGIVSTEQSGDTITAVVLPRGNSDVSQF